MDETISTRSDERTEVASRDASQLAALVHGVFAVVRTRTALAIEVAALRQQLAVLKQKRPRPRLTRADRAFWIALRRVWSGWTNALVIVKPETVVRWHRTGFRMFWGWKSRRRAGRPRMHPEIRALIRRMAQENRWRAPRIHAELLKLGFDVSERTVSRYLPKRPAEPDAIKRWKVFLKNHREALAGMDFFVVPSGTFRVLYVWFVIHHARRRILHLNVTTNPSADWVIQQLREAFPYDTAPSYLIFDRDSIFSAAVKDAARSMGAEPLRTAYRSPWQNGVAERWILSARTELLDHVVVFNERHLLRLLREYVAYYHEDRCHVGRGSRWLRVPRKYNVVPRRALVGASEARNGTAHARSADSASQPGGWELANHRIIPVISSADGFSPQGLPSA